MDSCWLNEGNIDKVPTPDSPVNGTCWAVTETSDQQAKPRLTTLSLSYYYDIYVFVIYYFIVHIMYILSGYIAFYVSVLGKY